LTPGRPAIVDPKIVTLLPAKRRKDLFERRKGGDVLGSLPTAMIIPSLRTRSGCCTAAARGNTATPPINVMNSQRCI
jgi:hypothetical protein